MGEAARVANERIDTANRGKKMLDEGGPDVELKLRCKRQCRKTVEDDGKQVGPWTNWRAIMMTPFRSSKLH